MNLNVTSFYTETNSFLFPPSQRNWQVVMKGSERSLTTAETTEKMTVPFSPVSSPLPSLTRLHTHRTEMRLKSAALGWPALFLCHTLLCWALSHLNQSRGDTYVVWKPCSTACPKGGLSLCTKRKSTASAVIPWSVCYLTSLGVQGLRIPLILGITALLSPASEGGSEVILPLLCLGLCLHWLKVLRD